MVVDETGGDGLALHVDDPPGRPAQLAYLDNLPFGYPDVTPERRHARAIDHAPVAKKQIICHGCPPFFAVGLILSALPEGGKRPLDRLRSTVNRQDAFDDLGTVLRQIGLART